MNITRYGMVLTGLLLLCGTTCAVHASNPTQVKLNIPAQAMDAALNDLSAQSGIQFIFSTKDVMGSLKAQSLVGTYTVADALGKLLQHSGLTYEFVNEKTVAIRPLKQGEKASNVSPADQMRVAVINGEAHQSEDNTRQENGQEVIVTAKKESWAMNADIERTVDDAQPYYIFNRETILRSGATNIEDFLKQQLTMNAVASTTSQQTQTGNSYTQNQSVINLRGLGADKTLVLIDGRRYATPIADSFGGASKTQTDLNGIPLSAIDRIEVLPSSASGIYGASALGGVVNVILKKNYTGAEAWVSYDGAWNSSAATQKLGFNIGHGFNDGKTSILASAQWVGSQTMVLEDRRELFDRGFSIISRNAPETIYFGEAPLGALPNIQSLGHFDYATGIYTPPTNLVLLDGTVLPSMITFVPAGTSTNTPRAELNAGLLANAGQYNLDLPPTSQGPTGLRRPLSAPFNTRSLRASLRQTLRPNFEVTVGATRYENYSSFYRPLIEGRYINAGDPTNPFQNDIYIKYPDSLSVFKQTTHAKTDSLTLTFDMKLPHLWSAQLDYSWSENTTGYDQVIGTDYTQLALEQAGSNPIDYFVDTLAHPIDLRAYGYHYKSNFPSNTQNVALRGSGTLMALPWGVPTLTVGLEHRIYDAPTNNVDYIAPFTAADSGTTILYGRQQIADSAYAETSFPLISEGWLPGVHALSLQVAGRIERYKVDTGTDGVAQALDGTVQYYIGPTDADAQPYFSSAKYDSKNHTVGVKYQPVPEVVIRSSISTAFLPPSPNQLLTNVVPNQGQVVDPVNGTTTVEVISGGNPDLGPQSSRTMDAGIIWEPSWQPLKGLRLNAEYYQIAQYNAITTLGAQFYVDHEAQYPDRVTRDSQGRIASVDNSAINQFSSKSQGWDFTVGYRRETNWGTFNLRATESIIQHLRNQYTVTSAEYDAVGFPSEVGAAQYKANVHLDWERENAAMGWTVRYFGAYQQFGSPGGPYSTQFANGGSTGRYTLQQGGFTIPSQLYHDLFLQYTFNDTFGSGSVLSSFLSDISVQLNINNVFGTKPPFDAFYDFYSSPYGDTRLRSYSFSVRKQF